MITKETIEKERNGKAMMFLGVAFVGMMFISAYLADNNIISSYSFVASIIIILVALIISIKFLWK